MSELHIRNLECPRSSLCTTIRHPKQMVEFVNNKKTLTTCGWRQCQTSTIPSNAHSNIKHPVWVETMSHPSDTHPIHQTPTIPFHQTPTIQHPLFHPIHYPVRHPPSHPIRHPLSYQTPTIQYIRHPLSYQTPTIQYIRHPPSHPIRHPPSHPIRHPLSCHTPTIQYTRHPPSHPLYLRMFYHVASSRVKLIHLSKYAPQNHIYNQMCELLTENCGNKWKYLQNTLKLNVETKNILIIVIYWKVFIHL